VTQARVAFLCLTLTALSLAGCGRGIARLSGVVRFQGKTVASGTVNAVGVDNRPRIADIGSDGSYTFTDLPAGPVRFFVLSPEPSKDDPDRPRKDLSPKKLLEGVKLPPQLPRPARLGPDSALWFPLPERYSRYDTSGLEAVLQPGENRHDLELE
jgi:hypothetical protein